jgi:hypothetical protein
LRLREAEYESGKANLQKVVDAASVLAQERDEAKRRLEKSAFHHGQTLHEFGEFKQKAEARAERAEGLLRECWSFLDTVEWDDNTADDACDLKEIIDAALAEMKEGADHA